MTTMGPKETEMLKPITDSFKQVYPEELAAKIERRKQARNEADHKFDSHRDICPECNGKDYKTISSYEHKCDKGFVLALTASQAHRILRNI